jgi:hypothetical protein
MYQPPVVLGKSCLLRVNRESKKVTISSFTEKSGGQVKVELARPLLSRKSASTNLVTTSLYSISKQRTFDEIQNELEDSSSCGSGSDPDSDDSSSSVRIFLSGLAHDLH